MYSIKQEYDGCTRAESLHKISTLSAWKTFKELWKQARSSTSVLIHHCVSDMHRNDVVYTAGGQTTLMTTYAKP